MQALYKMAAAAASRPAIQSAGRGACSIPPLCIDLFCGLGGWAEGFLAEGYRVIGFDIERRPYPGRLVLQDVRTLDGAQFRDAAIIVASPPCQEYSYRAMPWKRAKALPPPSNELFDACFRIQREATAAAGHYVPMVVENVRGAEKWVGHARWHFGSYFLWGDVPALMPKVLQSHRKVPTYSDPRRNGGRTVHLTSPQENARALPAEGLKFGGHWWRGTNELIQKNSSHSPARKAAAALVAKIPFDLAQHIARVYKPEDGQGGV